jgi:hypothetical protein
VLSGEVASELGFGFGFKHALGSSSVTVSLKTGNQVIGSVSRWSIDEPQSAIRLDSSNIAIENTFDGVAKEMKTQTIQKRKSL